MFKNGEELLKAMNHLVERFGRDGSDVLFLTAAQRWALGFWAFRHYRLIRQALDELDSLDGETALKEMPRYET